MYVYKPNGTPLNFIYNKPKLKVIEDVDENFLCSRRNWRELTHISAVYKLKNAVKKISNWILFACNLPTVYKLGFS